MKKLFFGIAILLSTSMYAGYFKSGDLWYYYSNSSSTTVSATSDQTSGKYAGLTEIVIPDSVMYNEKAYSVTSINSSAFSGCSSINSITIPTSVTTIGEYAFKNCSSLIAIKIPAEVKIINYQTFYNCTSLSSIAFHDSIKSVDNTAFSGCSSLKSVIWNAKHCADFTSAPFSHLAVITFGDSVEHIPAYICNIANKLRTATIPNSVKSIGTKAFDGVETIYMKGTTPPTLASNDIVNRAAIIIVPDAALSAYRSSWPSFTKQIISESGLQKREVTITANPSLSALHDALGESTLLNTFSLKVNGTINSYDIMLIRNKMLNLRYLDLSGAEVVANEYEYYTGYCTHDNMLENYAFSELNLRVVHLPKNLIKIHDCFTSCLYLDTVYCQPGLQTIGKLTFDHCSSLRHVDIKEGLVTIGENAFSETGNLQAVTLPNSLETIGSGAFYNTGLLSLTIPANVSSIGQGAFASRITSAYSTHTSSDSIQSHFGSYYAGIYSGAYCGGGRLQVVKIAENSLLKTIQPYTFLGQDALQSIDWESSNIQRIGRAALAFCKSLKVPQFPKKLKTIDRYAFDACSSMDTLVLPPRLETIGGHAFKQCTSLDVIKISSSVRNINNYAFTGCSNVSRVYTYTVEPTNILQQTFSCWHVASLYVPSTSYYNYYYNTQWSQFINLFEFDEDYDYFYLNGDYYLGGEYGEITGEPDIDLNPNSGLIIIGDETIVVGDVTYNSDENASPSIITEDNLSIDTLRIVYPQSKGKWHFLTFPFNINRENVQCNSEFVIRYYDGQLRAQNGSGGWQNVPVGKEMYNGQGYIFQSANNDTLQLIFSNPKLPSEDVSLPLYIYEATNPWDANWNMVGNPFLAYYDLDSIKGFTYPIITWNGKGYDTYRPGDDVYHFKPLEGFFIQNSNLLQVTLPISGRETRTQANAKLANSATSRKNMVAKTIATSRQLINLELSDSAYTDRTRIVFNADASIEYEMGVDANKFISTSAPVQLYSLGKNKEQYSINERPLTTSGEMIQLGYYAAYAGTFTLSASRMDTTITIFDNVTNQYVDLSKGDYMFSTEAGYHDTRFAMSAAKLPSDVIDVKDINPNELHSVIVYSMMGLTLAEDADFSTLHLPAGVYMIQSKSATYKIVIP